MKMSEKELASIIAEAVKKALSKTGRSEIKTNKKGISACARIRAEALRIKWGKDPAGNKRTCTLLAKKFGVKKATAKAQVSRSMKAVGKKSPAGIVDNWNS